MGTMAYMSDISTKSSVKSKAFQYTIRRECIHTIDTRIDTHRFDNNNHVIRWMLNDLARFVHRKYMNTYLLSLHQTVLDQWANTRMNAWKMWIEEEEMKKTNTFLSTVLSYMPDTEQRNRRIGTRKEWEEEMMKKEAASQSATPHFQHVSEILAHFSRNSEGRRALSLYFNKILLRDVYVRH